MSITIRQKPDFAKRAEMLRRLKLETVRESVNDIEREILTRYAAGTGPATLGVRSSRLRSSVRREIKAVGPWLSGRVFIAESGGNTIPVYARILEKGGTIKPKNGRYLSIPIGPLARRSGLSPMNFPFGSFFFRSKKGNLIFAVREQVTRGKMTPLFVMKESVTIKARPVWGVTRANQLPRFRERVRAMTHAVAQGRA